MHMHQVYKLWKMKVTSSCGNFKTLHNDGTYLLLEREYYRVSKFYVNNSSYVEISAYLFWTLSSNKCRTLKLQNYSSIGGAH